MRDLFSPIKAFSEQIGSKFSGALLETISICVTSKTSPVLALKSQRRVGVIPRVDSRWQDDRQALTVATRLVVRCARSESSFV